ncbi:putative Integral membrane protein [uncultured Eubacteriales bacterium]|uniref:Putative Integral membrane protein n=1 Tax=uncultured Eubacteriales bacterium TaxID=172733 RepID=A0A212JUZ3_9FIRM|nr:putative Integral membrane protein [uncultured Eubacteriales bacterium]
MANTNRKINRMVRLGVLTAIIFLLAFTPLGYLVIGPIAATTIQMPVIIGAVLMGPAAGAILGGFFGLSAIIKVLTMPGADVFATAVLTYTPLGYLVICLVPRILMGWLSGLLGKVLNKAPILQGKKSVIGYGIAGLVGSLLNTVLYLGALWGIAAQVIANSYGVDLSGVGAIVIATATGAGIPEAIVSCLVVAAVCRAMKALDKTL